MMRKQVKLLANFLGATKALTNEYVELAEITEEELDQMRVGLLARPRRAEVAKLLSAKGMSTRQISDITGWSRETIAADLRIGRNLPEDGRNLPSLSPEREAYEARKQEGVLEDFNTLVASGQKFGVIYADPPWSFKVYSGKGKARSADRHYDTQSLDDIKALPVEKLAADDCALFLWAVMPELPGALEVIKAWGFTYKTVGFTWVKQNADRSPFWGMGYWTRANAELCLLATRGAPKRQAMDVHQIVMSQVGEHSRKPDEVQVRIERLLAGPYLELYARRATEGWITWGDEVSRNLFQQDIPEFVA
jgi:N6-adenosine-specific RNA methylase IME4